MSFAERAVEALREAGGRMTPQRQLIIDILTNTQERMDAESLYQQVRQHDNSVSLATVYRTLSALETVGLVYPHYISSEHSRKYIEPVSERYHFTCRECHQVMSFTSSQIESLKHELEQTLLVQDINICVCVNGLCPDCQQQQNVT